MSNYIEAAGKAFNEFAWKTRHEKAWTERLSICFGEIPETLETRRKWEKKTARDTYLGVYERHPNPYLLLVVLHSLPPTNFTRHRDKSNTVLKDIILTNGVSPIKFTVPQHIIDHIRSTAKATGFANNPLYKDFFKNLNKGTPRPLFRF
jgi:hypothetical protein